MKAHYIETEAEMNALYELPYHSDAPYEPHEGLVDYVLAAELKVGKKAYMICEANGVYVEPGVITEMITVTPADDRCDTEFRHRHYCEDSFLVGNTRYHVGIDKNGEKVE